MIIALDYRVCSIIETQFRQRATLWLKVCLPMVCASICKNIDSLEKMRLYMIIRLKKCSCSMLDGFQAHAELTI